MQHMDEGLLQAWLDGPRGGLDEAERGAVEEHVAVCPVCAERLESLRASSRRTAELLTLAGEPEDEDEIPAFAAVVQRARELGEEAAPPSTVRPWWGRRTAWAASIMIALGAGWLANEWNRAPGEAVLAPVQVRAPSRPAPEREAANDASAEAAGAAIPPSELARRSAPAPAEEAPERALAALADAAPASGDSAARSPEAPSALAEDRGVAGARMAEQEARLAPPPVEPDPVFRVDDATVAPRAPVVRGRVVDAGSGMPLQAAQVFVPGTSIGGLTNSDGIFALPLEPVANSGGAELRVRIELVGYRLGEVVLGRPASDTVLGDVGLSRTALGLDAVVVTGETPEAREAEGSGFAATVPTGLEDGRWRSVSLTEAQTFLSFRPSTVPDLPVTSVHVGTFDEVPVVRVVQALEGGRTLTLIQSDRAVAFGPDDLPGSTVSRTRVDGVRIQGWGDLPLDSLRAVMGRLDPGPDGPGGE